jgi:hypothetical protein
MAAPPPLPGHLSNEEVERLLEPIADFALAVRDMTSLIQVWNYDEWSVGPGRFKMFTLGRSMGSGATLVTGNTSIEVGIFEHSQMALGHLRLRRRSVHHYLEAMFSKAKRLKTDDLPQLDSKWMATSREPSPARYLLRRVSQPWVRVAAGSRMQCEFLGHRLAIHAPGGAVSRKELRQGLLVMASACTG